MTPATLVFSHANGFPAGTYRVLFEAWRAAGWRVEAIGRFGHNPAFAVSSNWPHVRDELIHFIDGLGLRSPAWLVGHSLGGFLSLLAACHRPDLVAGVVMLDSPVLTGWKAHAIRSAKLTRLIGRVSPGKVSLTRRDRWPSHADMHRHFAGKKAFARWDERLLHDYVQAGTEHDAVTGGVKLAFDRAVETQVYNTLPHHLGALLRRHPPRCPVGFVGGTESAEVRQVGMAGTQALTSGHVAWVEGSHLFPMERPDAAAAAVLKMVAELSALAKETAR